MVLELLLVIVLLVVGFVLLVKGADYLVEGASSVAKKWKVSDLIIGLTIVAFGTSLPELLVNLYASYSGNTDIAIGNILGSNIVNVFLILGITAIIYPISVKSNTVYKEIPFTFLAAIALAVLANDVLVDGASFSVLSRIDGIILLLFFVVYMYYIFGLAKSEKEQFEEHVEVMSYKKSWLFILIGVFGLFIGGKLIVDNAIIIAKMIGMSEAVIGLTIIAIGTSLPELVTSVSAALKKNADIAIGNVVGSNIFNIFWILGISALISPLPFSKASNIDLLMVILASVLLFVLVHMHKKKMMTKKTGILFVLIYIVYLIYLLFFY